MATETVGVRYTGIDGWPTISAVEAMFEGQLAAVAAVRPALKGIAAAAEQGAERLQQGGRLIFSGAGTSGRLAVLDGVELGPTFGWPADRIAYALAGGPDALTQSVEQAEDDSAAAERDVAALSVSANDVFIAVAASGRTPYTLAALVAAGKAGALTVAIANNFPAMLLDAAAIGICAETGEEAIAGSTRMKAGTAQKVILSLLSTAIMIRCGRVYDGLMVDMVISNEKLTHRAVDIVSRLAKSDEATARRALDIAGGNIKRGVLVAVGAAHDEATALLDRAGGDLRRAIAAIRTETTSDRT